MPIECLVRELREEIGINLSEQKERLRLFGIYNNTLENKNDYILVFLCRLFEKEYQDFTHITPNSYEISEVCWQDIGASDHLPSPGTRRRIEEFLGKPDTVTMGKW